MGEAVQTQSGSGLNFDFSSANFAQLRDLVFQHTGISLSDEKKQLAYSRFSKRLRALGLSRFEDYIALLGDERSDELQDFISAITTNFTSFFRESHHFDFLAQEVALLGKSNSRIRIWSAGCSSGEEPYSMAVTLLDRVPECRGWDIKILASDLDRKMVETASKGIYTLERLNGVDERIKKTWFMKGRGANQGMVKVKPDLSSLIEFRQLNLLHSWPMKGPFDIIFCRNVIIYFDKSVQAQLFKQFARVLKPGGKMVIGHSENLAGVTNDFRLIGRTIYERV